MTHPKNHHIWGQWEERPFRKIREIEAGESLGEVCKRGDSLGEAMEGVRDGGGEGAKTQDAKILKSNNDILGRGGRGQMISKKGQPLYCSCIPFLTRKTEMVSDEVSFAAQMNRQTLQILPPFCGHFSKKEKMTWNYPRDIQ